MEEEVQEEPPPHHQKNLLAQARGFDADKRPCLLTTEFSNYSDPPVQNSLYMFSILAQMKSFHCQ